MNARDVFLPQALTHNGLTKLTGRITAILGKPGLCPDYGLPLTIDRKAIAESKEPRFVEFVFGAKELEFILDGPGLGYSTACGVHTVKVPYLDVADLMNPEVLALLPASATTSPPPSPTLSAS
jgi:serine/threonine-protein kinase